MFYRCPYCKKSLGETLQPRCPGCGKVMVVPAMRESSERTARKRKIENLWRKTEQQKAELRGVVTPGLFHNPKFYFGVIVVLAVLGVSLFRATDSAATRQAEAPYLRATRHVDVLAEALGRYRFHTGAFPDTAQGLAALVRDPQVPQWNGPYINQLRKDPWGTPYVYENAGPDGLPVVLSCGPDKTRGTPDDLTADAARFDPGTAWTNGWVSARERLPGITVLPSRPQASPAPKPAESRR